MESPSEIATIEEVAGDDGEAGGEGADGSAYACANSSRGPINDCPVSDDDQLVDEGVTSGSDGLIDVPGGTN